MNLEHEPTLIQMKWQGALSIVNNSEKVKHFLNQNVRFEGNIEIMHIPVGLILLNAENNNSKWALYQLQMGFIFIVSIVSDLHTMLVSVARRMKTIKQSHAFIVLLSAQSLWELNICLMERDRRPTVLKRLRCRKLKLTWWVPWGQCND